MNSSSKEKFSNEKHWKITKSVYLCLVSFIIESDKKKCWIRRHEMDFVD